MRIHKRETLEKTDTDYVIQYGLIIH